MKKLLKTLLPLLLITVFFALPLRGQYQADSKATPSVLAKEAVKIARSEIGLSEQGNNRGKEIDRKNDLVGNPRGSPWCMATVYEWIDIACKKLGIKNPLMRTGRVASQLKYAKMIGSGLSVLPNKIIAKTKLNEGDIFIISSKGIGEGFIGKDWNGHTGLIQTDYG